ncbi:MAG: GTPase domain-containing protein [Deltaproteobacteria bacterium]|nr:GTPase domain-containing protein [Deltaproteobacteria bacterium]MBW1927939.1 GTPase domain-containing protein [Deltaproteobacteria bacterium]MBW2024820.1 GTPase domain-containing protein [Deltaproteobacteria bacterium]MBW2124718.1 GTPase domain-containing protein [Deltaproteobacteria bacterium]RLB24174.1 MAG: gliding motility protein [Deltaproteobacteria bacterium]
MAFVNLKNKEVQVKIVYYGPGRGGKTTNLEYIYKKFNSRIKTEMITIKTQGDRTLFFDFLPLGLGKIKGHEIKIQLYTVPGQVKYNATRRLVLRGVDGVVFVADSMAVRRKHNILSLKNLQENLAAYNKSIFKIPLVMQYNKRDLASQGIPLLSVATLQKDLNSKLKAPALEASALEGKNVTETLKKIILLTVASLERELQ